jgi:hypothetical protein
VPPQGLAACTVLIGALSLPNDMPGQQPSDAVSQLWHFEAGG